MRVMDILTDPWAIAPAKLVEVCEVYNTHLRGDKVDLKALEARLGRPMGNQKSYQVVNGKAVLPVEGVLSKRISLLHDISGGTSTELLQDQILAALADPAISEIILDIDSPGGAVDGVKTLSDAIYNARGKKPITAWVDGLAASAAYWIASAADRIYIKDATTMTGSIGVVTAHRDYSEMEKRIGIKTTEITAGKYKRIDTQYAPLSEEGMAYIKSRVDSLYTIFVDDVARNRGVAVDVVLTDMADGRVFVGTDAIAAGLVDGVSTWDEVIAPSARRPMRGAAANHEPAAESSTSTEDSMEGFTQEQLDAAVAEARQVGVAEGTKAGADAERSRIQSVLAISAPGHEALVQTLAFDGTTTPEQARAALFDAQQARKEETAKELEDGSPAPLKSVAGASGAQEDPNAELKARWDASPSVRSLYSNDFDAYLKAETLRQEKASQGGVRILTKQK